MRSGRSLAAPVAAILLAVAAMTHAQRPPAGQTLDVTREIALAAKIAPPCLAVLASNASVLLSRAQLEAFAGSTPRQWRTETERLALVRGRRASALLGLADASTGPGGCAPVEAARLGDAAHLVADLLESGDAAVLGQGAATPDRSVGVRYLGMRSAPTVGFGEIYFLRGEPPRGFFRVEWWRS